MPVRIFARVREDRRNLIPVPLGRAPLQVEGLSNGLTRHGQLQGQAPGIERCCHPWRTRLLGTSLQIVRVSEDGGDRRGHERGMQERLQGAGPFGVNRVEAVLQLVQLDAAFDLPAHPVEVRHLPWADPGREIGEEETMTFRGLDADEAQLHGILAFADRHIGVNGPAVEEQDLVLTENIEVSPPLELLGDLPARERVDLGLPVLFEADHEPHPMGFAGPEAVEAGISQSGQQATVSPGLVDGQMPAVRLPGRAEMVAHQGTAADGEDLMHLECRVLPGPRKLLAQGVADRDRRRIDYVPILDPTERSRQIDLLGAGIGQSPVGQGGHEPFERLVEPPLEGGTRHAGDFTLQIRAQRIRLVGTAWRPGRDYHSPHEHPEVQLALSRDHAERLAEAADLLRGP